MRGMMLAVLMGLVSGFAVAANNDSAIGNETPTADQAQDKAEGDQLDSEGRVGPELALGCRRG